MIGFPEFTRYGGIKSVNDKRGYVGNNGIRMKWVKAALLIINNYLDTIAQIGE